MICVSGNLVFAQRIMFSGCFDLSGNLEIFIARKDISHDMRVFEHVFVCPTDTRSLHCREAANDPNSRAGPQASWED